jgi:hypothetical protein
MPLARAAADALARDGYIEILQKGTRVPPGEYRGPIRLRILGKPSSE